jgi:hypothetical protein
MWFIHTEILVTLGVFHRLKETIVNYHYFMLTKKVSLALILIFTAISVVDSTIVKFYSYSGVESDMWLNNMTFFIFSIIFMGSSTALLSSVNKITSSDENKFEAPLGLRYFNRAVIATQVFTVAIILVIILEMIVLNKYSITFLRAQTYISHLSPLVFLSFLIFLFGSWLTLKRNYVIMIYAVSFSLVSINLIVSLIYLESFYSISNFADVKPYAIASYVISFGGLPFSGSLSTVFDGLSLSSFLLMWIATSVLLSQYRYRMGKIKYFSLMSIPLIYYIFPFQNYFGDIFLSLLQSSPVFVSIIYILIFSATKQVGALLFSLAFWTASALVYDNRVSKSLLISSIGMAIIFGSLEISPLQYHVYPPYGFITEAFMPLGAYLLFVGIFTSAKNISRDSELRKEFYKSAASQLSVLKAIGVSQMEKELEQQVKSVYRRSGIDEKEQGLRLEEEQLKFEEENAKEILRDVLNELYHSKGKKER